MKIILRKDFETLGKVGDVVTVKDGYARNFLLPQKIAYTATPSAIKVLEEEKKQIAKAEQRLIKESDVLKTSLEKLSIAIAVKVGEEDKLFGSVTSQSIADTINAQGFKIDKKNILLEDSIRSLGIFEVNIKLHQSVTATVKVWVVKE